MEKGILANMGQLATLPVFILFEKSLFEYDMYTNGITH